MALSVSHKSETGVVYTDMETIGTEGVGISLDLSPKKHRTVVFPTGLRWHGVRDLQAGRRVQKDDYDSSLWPIHCAKSRVPVVTQDKYIRKIPQIPIRAI